MERIILHCDMDRFYCAVEEKHNPALSKIPFAVCGDPEMRHSIVMSANMITVIRGFHQINRCDRSADDGSLYLLTRRT